MQGGILKLDERRELLFVTLDKSGTGFSPSTRYKDHAISRDLFHWETQGAASVSRPSGQRYIESPGNGMTFQLFVRSAPTDAFGFLGPVRYQSHTGDRPNRCHLARRAPNASQPFRALRYPHHGVEPRRRVPPCLVGGARLGARIRRTGGHRG